MQMNNILKAIVLNYIRFRTFKLNFIESSSLFVIKYLHPAFLYFVFAIKLLLGDDIRKFNIDFKLDEESDAKPDSNLKTEIKINKITGVDTMRTLWSWKFKNLDLTILPIRAQIYFEYSGKDYIIYLDRSRNQYSFYDVEKKKETAQNQLVFGRFSLDPIRN